MPYAFIPARSPTAEYWTVVMNPREQFLTDEFLRYGVECRRMANLARRPESSGAKYAMSGTRQRSAEWFGQIWLRYAGPRKRDQKLSPSWSDILAFTGIAEVQSER